MALSSHLGNSAALAAAAAATPSTSRTSTSTSSRSSRSRRSSRRACSAILQHGLTEESRDRYKEFLKNKNRSKTVERVGEVEYVPFQYQQDYLLVKEASRTSLVESIQNFLTVSERQGGFQAAAPQQTQTQTQTQQQQQASRPTAEADSVRSGSTVFAINMLFTLSCLLSLPQPSLPDLVKIVSLEQLSDAWSAALQQLLSQGQVIVSTRKLSADDAQRAIDFISGAAAVIGATCHEVSEGCYHFGTFGK